jgi:hypothetical protein
MGKTNTLGVIRLAFSLLCYNVHISTVKVNDILLNTFLPPTNFKAIRKTLKTETLMFLRQEIKRLE